MTEETFYGDHLKRGLELSARTASEEPGMIEGKETIRF